MSMKALNEVKLPKVAEKGDFRKVQTEQMNEQRLNQNFKTVAETISDMEDLLDTMPTSIKAEVLSKIVTPTQYVTKQTSDGIWEWRKWKDGHIEAFTLSLSIQCNCTTANGSLYSCDKTITLPENVFSEILSCTMTPQSSSEILATIKTISTSSVTLTVFATTSKTATVSFNFYIYGK